MGNKNNGQQKTKERMQNYFKKKELHSWVYLFIVFILSVNKTKFITA